VTRTIKKLIIEQLATCISNGAVLFAGVVVDELFATVVVLEPELPDTVLLAEEVLEDADDDDDVVDEPESTDLSAQITTKTEIRARTDRVEAAITMTNYRNLMYL
jgi:hypothetical protein